jgi:uncharacterized membrane protein YkoI
MRWLLALLLALALAGPQPAEAQRRDHDRARSAVQSGEARPLEEILSRLHGSHPGRVLDAQLQGQGDGLAYRIRILAPDGRVVDLTVDARSGRVLQSRGGR